MILLPVARLATYMLPRLSMRILCARALAPFFLVALFSAVVPPK